MKDTEFAEPIRVQANGDGSSVRCSGELDGKKSVQILSSLSKEERDEFNERKRTKKSIGESSIEEVSPMKSAEHLLQKRNVA